MRVLLADFPRRAQPKKTISSLFLSLQPWLTLRRGWTGGGRGGGGGGGGKVLGIVSPEDTNGFWCRVFFTQHLTHGAVLLQSLHFNIHYDDVRRSNGPTIGHLHRPEGESIFKTLKRRPFSLHLHTISCLGNTCIPVCVTLFSCVCVCGKSMSEYLLCLAMYSMQANETLLLVILFSRRSTV